MNAIVTVEVPGSEVPGSEAFGSEVLGSEAFGSEVSGSPRLRAPRRAAPALIASLVLLAFAAPAGAQGYPYTQRGLQPYAETYERPAYRYQRPADDGRYYQRPSADDRYYQRGYQPEYSPGYRREYRPDYRPDYRPAERRDYRPAERPVDREPQQEVERRPQAEPEQAPAPRAVRRNPQPDFQPAEAPVRRRPQAAPETAPAEPVVQPAPQEPQQPTERETRRDPRPVAPAGPAPELQQAPQAPEPRVTQRTPQRETPRTEQPAANPPATADRPEPGSSSTETDILAGPPPSIGVQAQPLSDDLALYFGVPRRGALVVAVRPNGPAATAGLAVGDIIVGIGANRVVAAPQLGREIRALRPGTPTRLGVVTNRRQRVVTITPDIVRAPAPLAQVTPVSAPAATGTDVAALGLAVAPGAGGEGIVITRVDPSTGATIAALKVGETIIEADFSPVASAADLDSVVSAANGRPNGLVLLRLRTAEGRYIMRAVRFTAR